jgi:hypothetical protein
MLDQLREGHYTEWFLAKALDLSGVDENATVMVKTMKKGRYA